MQGKEGGWKRGRWERGVGRERKGRGRGFGADADGSPVGTTPGDWREEKLERWMGWCHGESLLFVRGISRRVRHGWEGKSEGGANERLD